MNPAHRSAKVVESIAVLRATSGASSEYARALSTPAHVLELNMPAEATEPVAESEAVPLLPIDVHEPGELSERLLRALFGAWPPK